MPKEKKIIAYSRNGCKITKVMYVDMTKPENQRNNHCLLKGNVVRNLEPPVDTYHQRKQKTKEEYEYEYITKESPLGFWYKVPDVSKNNQSTISAPPKKTTATLYHVSVLIDGTRYELEYPKTCRDVSIGIETRPWDVLSGYTGIQDHMIQALYKEVQKFFDTLESYSKLIGDITELRKEVMKDLFGSKGKPEIQQNNIKIEAHGFDIKTSFRKRPE